ncbi:MAG: NAD-dependent epimerase [Euryarchaeota archaeon]|mgnify:FL=1|nr:NAD-dependent epimerase [Euryarchaeota archaeon]|tara:strand:+ start:2447 stop:3172 length:726 start_codon:yes stop_codon:yes gene_type:complete
MRTAIVTGGGRGIGAAISRKLAEDGYRILLTYSTSSKPAELLVDDIRNSGIDAVAVNCDVTDAREVALLATHPWVSEGIEVLVLNHGRYDRIDAKSLDYAHLRRTMSTNFEGSFLVWDSVKSSLNSEARICVIGSQLGTRGSPHGADYSASKAALALWARSLAQAVGADGKRVNIIAPGFVDTDILAGDTPEKRASRIEEVPLKRIGTPDDIAEAVSYLVSDEANYITGAVIHVNGGLYLP